MNRSGSIAQIAAALATAQAEITNPPRNREVTVRSDKGNYKFKYATLDAIIDTVRPALTKNGLWFVQTPAQVDGKPVLVTTLTHKSGEWMESAQPIMVERPGSQAFGSALTYARRYALTSILGVAADEDDDGNGADGNHIEQSRDRATPPKPTGNAPDKAKDKAANSAGVDPVVAWATTINGQIKAATSFEQLATIDADVRNKADLPEPTRKHLLANLDKMQKHLAGATKQAAE